MPNRLRDYQRPADLHAALDLLHRPDVPTAPILLGPRPPVDPLGDAEAAVDLSALQLNYIRDAEEAIHIGAMTSLQDIAGSILLTGLANGILPQAARLAAGLGLRHVATLAGVLVAPDSPAEIRLALGALNAQVIVQGKARVEFPVRDWHRLAPGEIVIEVKIPHSHVRLIGALARVARAPLDTAIVAAIAVVEHDGSLIRQARLQVGPSPRCGAYVTMLAESLTPARLLQIALEDLDTDNELISDYRGSAEYRREMASLLARRALTEALKTLTASREQ